MAKTIKIKEVYVISGGEPVEGVPKKLSEFLDHDLLNMYGLSCACMVNTLPKYKGITMPSVKSMRREILRRMSLAMYPVNFGKKTKRKKA